jgi:hypothetical protein
VRRRGPRREPGPVERTVQPVAGTVAREHAARAVRAVRGRREPRTRTSPAGRRSRARASPSSPTRGSAFVSRAPLARGTGRAAGTGGTPPRSAATGGTATRVRRPRRLSFFMGGGRSLEHAALLRGVPDLDPRRAPHEEPERRGPFPAPRARGRRRAGSRSARSIMPRNRSARRPDSSTRAPSPVTSRKSGLPMRRSAARAARVGMRASSRGSP